MKLTRILEHILVERFVNAISDQDKLKYVDQVWDMMQKAYAPIGGFKSVNSKEELIKDTSIWKMVRKDGKIIAAKLYADKRGRKSIAGAAEVGEDGKATEEGKKALLSIMIEDIKLNRSWAEVSGKVEHLMLKHGSVPIPNKYAAEILGKEILELNPDGYHYTRMIAGKPYEKVIVGTVKGFEQLTEK
ncbi:MAG: hypothetical protein EBZ49_01320 [Proteobacteria bacterium]|nr:hypothetical protein [Pseudomonadota bacterium]